jgi:hypothetical protein
MPSRHIIATTSTVISDLDFKVKVNFVSGRCASNSQFSEPAPEMLLLR